VAELIVRKSELKYTPILAVCPSRLRRWITHRVPLRRPPANC